MEFRIHRNAIEEFKELPEKILDELDEEIESRKRREKNILDQRGSGTSYDSHGEPVNYFKLETSEDDYRIFFGIKDLEIVLLGVRPRDNDTYINLRDYTRMMD